MQQIWKGQVTYCSLGCRKSRSDEIWHISSFQMAASRLFSLQVLLPPARCKWLTSLSKIDAVGITGQPQNAYLLVLMSVFLSVEIRNFQDFQTHTLEVSKCGHGIIHSHDGSMRKKWYNLPIYPDLPFKTINHELGSVNTLLKINMEQNHGGLEDYVPF